MVLWPEWTGSSSRWYRGARSIAEKVDIDPRIGLLYKREIMSTGNPKQFSVRCPKTSFTIVMTSPQSLARTIIVQFIFAEPEFHIFSGSTVPRDSVSVSILLVEFVPRCVIDGRRCIRCFDVDQVPPWTTSWCIQAGNVTEKHSRWLQGEVRNLLMQAMQNKWLLNWKTRSFIWIIPFISNVKMKFELELGECSCYHCGHN